MDHRQVGVWSMIWGKLAMGVLGWRHTVGTLIKELEEKRGEP